MTKLTPAKRLKQLRQSGWLEFVEFMEIHKVTPRQLVTGGVSTTIDLFRVRKTPIWMSDDLCYALYRPVDEYNYKFVGISEQISKKSNKSNKIVQKFNKNKG